MDNQKLTELITKCQMSDEQAFEQLFLLFQKNALNTAYLIVGDWFLAEETIQDVFIYIFNNIHNLKSPYAFTIWFNKILVRTANKRRNSILKYLFNFKHDSEIDVQRMVSSQNPEEDLIINELKEEIWQALLKLPLHYRTVVILKVYNDLTYEEISNILECAIGTVKSRYFKAKKRLEKLLAKNCLNDFLNNERRILKS